MTGASNITNIVHPRLAEREHDLIQSKLRNAMAAHGLDALILARGENVLYATGYQSALAYFSGIPAGVTMAVLASDGTCHLITSSLERHAATALTPDSVSVVDFPSWVFIDDGSEASRREGASDVLPFAASELALEIIRSSKPDAVIGIEADYITAPMWKYLTENSGEMTLKNGYAAIMESRRIKTPWEIGMMRHSAQFTERAMHKLASEIEPGMYPSFVENRIFEIGRAADVDHMITDQLFVFAHGPYYSLSGTPRHFRLRKGDVVKVDGGFFQLGYTSDLARTCVVGGEPDDATRRVFDALYYAFERGMEMIKPGVRLCDLYAEVRSLVENSGVIPYYGRGHMGHSIGVGPMLEEYPPISKNCKLEFEPGMVISYELSYFAAEGAPAVGGFNTEDSFVITDTGHERFTHAPNTLDYRNI
ncbi:MAG: aminopeptidase P family protein [Nitratireductor sp.]|nr:aminopeptidase P family protein [Nitratireductor sp.]